MSPVFSFKYFSEVFCSNVLLTVSRAPTSIPPGFSVPTKATPPGFPSHVRTGQAFDTSGLSFHIYLFIDSLFR